MILSQMSKQGDVRRSEIAALANYPEAPCDVGYLPHEDHTWTMVSAELRPLWGRHVAQPLIEARDRLRLPADRVPQLSLVSRRLSALTGFRYGSVRGTVPADEFFTALADQTFLSTQFIRQSGTASYTPEPDVIHEILGHGTSLATPQLAELHQLAGRAAVAAPHALTEIAAVFWYSVEFGLLRTSDGPKAYGTGLLSSPGELAWFASNAEMRPINIDQMIATPYDITRFQPVLFAADSLDHVSDVIGGYFASLTTKGARSHVSP